MSDKWLSNYINSEIEEGVTEEKLLFIMKYADTKIAEYNRSKWSIIKWLSTVTFALVTGLFALMTYYNNQSMSLIVTFISVLKEHSGDLKQLTESINTTEDDFINLACVFVVFYFHSVLAVIIFKNVRKKKWSELHSNALKEYLTFSKEDD